MLNLAPLCFQVSKRRQTYIKHTNTKTYKHKTYKHKNIQTPKHTTEYYIASEDDLINITADGQNYYELLIYDPYE